MPMYPYGGVNENAPAASMDESGGSNEAIPDAPAAASEPAPQGFPLPGLGIPAGMFDSSYTGAGSFHEPGESGGPTNWKGGDAPETVQSLGTVPPPKARPVTG